MISDKHSHNFSSEFLYSLAKRTTTCQMAEWRVHSISHPVVHAADEWNDFNKYVLAPIHINSDINVLNWLRDNESVYPVTAAVTCHYSKAATLQVHHNG